MAHSLIAPHGGTLVTRLLEGASREQALEKAQTLPRIVLNEVSLCDLEMLAGGGLSPLKGFMNKTDYDSVVHHMRLSNGLAWSIPITLAVSIEQANSIHIGQEVALIENLPHEQRIIAILEVSDKFTYDKQIEVTHVYRTDDPAHPGVARILAQGEVLLGGEVHVVNFPTQALNEFGDIRFTPTQTRQIFTERGWKRIVAFQTRNPIHRAHEYLQKTALETVDGLLLHPLVGQTKSDDIPADVRIESYKVILEHYYPKERVLLSAFPAAMRYAGPREAIFHAIARKNYGCSHFIVGRDHAGVGNYYGTYDAHYIFDEFTPEEIGITPYFFEHAFYCKQCGALVTSKTCPHDKSEHLHLSGTQVRQMLARGELLPIEFTRPEVSRVLMQSTREKA
jgi:sulfate adenylyltransferase